MDPIKISAVIIQVLAFLAPSAGDLIQGFYCVTEGYSYKAFNHSTAEIFASRESLCATECGKQEGKYTSVFLEREWS